MDRYNNVDFDLECEDGENLSKPPLFSGIFKKPSKNADPPAKKQERLIANGDLSKSSDSLAESSKDKGGMLKGIFKKTNKVEEEKQEQISTQNDEPTDSSDSLAAKEKSGMIGGLLKRLPRPGHTRRPSQDLLEFSGSDENQSDNTNNTKESTSLFTGMFKKSPKFSRAAAPSQNDSTTNGDITGHKDEDDLSVSSELSGSSDNFLENQTKEKGGIFGVFKKKGAKSQSQEELSVNEEHFANNESPTEKSSMNDSSGMRKSTFYTDKQDKISNPDVMLKVENQPSPKKGKLGGVVAKLIPFQTSNKHEKQSGSSEEAQGVSSEKGQSNKQNTVVEAISKLNPFHSANKKDTNKTETATEQEGELQEEKPKVVKRNLIQQDRKETSQPPPVPPKPAKRDMKEMSASNKVKEGQSKDKSQSADEETKDDESFETKESENKVLESKTTKVKKLKKPNPFMPQVGVKSESDDEELNGEKPSSREEQTDEEKDQTEEKKVKKPKRHNPFMPRVKAKVIQKHADTTRGDAAENEGANRSLFDQLEDFRTEPSPPEGRQDMEDLMDWWNTVEPWEDTPQDEDMTEKEEAKAFAVTAEKVQKGIRVFNKLFSERAESLWQHVIDLNSIADGLDKFNKNTKIAQITGGSTSAIGGVATIAGLALAPVTMGTSLIVTAVGLGVATAGGLTSAGAGISNQVNNSMDRKKVEKIVEDYQEKITDLNKCLKFIKQGIENLRKFDLLKMKKNAYNQDFPALTSSFYEDGAMAGKAILINANEIMRVVQIANVAGSTAARAVQIASMATGVLTGLFVGMDIYFVAKDSKELKKGAKSEFAAKIRDVATQLHDGLVELNSIREELQSTTPDDASSKSKTLNETKENEEKSDSSEDEIDKIKKQIKKDLENRDYGS